MPFSTVDKESNEGGINCASNDQFGCIYYLIIQCNITIIFSGWWFRQTTDIALNGKYNPSLQFYGFRWYSVATEFIRPKRSEMKIRRIDVD
jgi:hypothetical protein